MRETIWALEVEVRSGKQHRADVVKIQRALIEARIEDARRAIAELLSQWPTN